MHQIMSPELTSVKQTGLVGAGLVWCLLPGTLQNRQTLVWWMCTGAHHAPSHRLFEGQYEEARAQRPWPGGAARSPNALRGGRGLRDRLGVQRGRDRQG